MSFSGPGENEAPSGAGDFHTTHWSLVLLAGQTKAPKADEALESLCRTYWNPLYAYVRRQGHSPHDAQDLTQEFFARLLEKKYLALAIQEREFDGDLYFFTEDPSPKTEQVAADSHVNVSLQSGDNYLSIAGTASVTRDGALIDELWNPYAEAWFEQGRDDPAVALLKVHADSAEYWTVDSPKPIALIKTVKAILTGERPDLATNTTVDL